VLESESAPYLRAERLLVPSLPGFSGNPTRRACEFLRASFLPAAGGAPAAGPGRLYVSRARAASRRVANEDEVWSVLRGFGFSRVELEDLAFERQAALFASAEWVVGPHGAGLANLVFCRPGTRVLEFFSPAYVNVCYWALSCQVGAEYRYLVGEGEAPPAYVDPHLGHSDILVDPERLSRALVSAGCEARAPGGQP
jgi:capsular polysaccharide biosynthesis protein